MVFATVPGPAQAGFGGYRGETISFSSAITNIGAYAFSGSRSLVNIAIPEDITGIGDYVFYDCEGLKAVSFLGDMPTCGFDIFGYLQDVADRVTGAWTDMARQASEDGCGFDGNGWWQVNLSPGGMAYASFAQV